MGMEEDLYRLLIGARLGVGSKVYWLAREQGESLPAVVLQKISGREDITMAGPTKSHQDRVQIDCLAEHYGAARRLARAVIEVLNGHKGGKFLGIFLESERDFSEPGDDPIFRVTLDFFINWRKTP